MKSSLKVLIIEDHPFIVEGYSNVLEHFASKNNRDVCIEIAKDCDSAISSLEIAQKTVFYDLVFLDIRIPPSIYGKILCGEDLGLKIRSLSQHCKIIVSTSYDDEYRLNNIIKALDPDGFLVKTDVGFHETVEAVETVLQDPPFYSRSIIKLMRKRLSNDMLIDHLDRQLLYHLSIGTKTKDLPNILPLSIAGIERRKRRLKRELNANSKGDFNLIEIAKIRGFI